MIRWKEGIQDNICEILFLTSPTKLELEEIFSSSRHVDYGRRGEEGMNCVCTPINPFPSVRFSVRDNGLENLVSVNP